MDTYNGLLIENCLDQVLNRLVAYEPKVLRSKSTQTVYVQFKNPELGTIRISDHPPLTYRDTWHVLLDAQYQKKKNSLKPTKYVYIYNPQMLDEFTLRFEQYAAKFLKVDKS